MTEQREGALSVLIVGVHDKVVGFTTREIHGKSVIDRPRWLVASDISTVKLPTTKDGGVIGADVL
jgi:hypothetical protein